MCYLPSYPSATFAGGVQLENLHQEGASGNDKLRYNDKDDQQDVLGVLHRLES